MKDLLDQWRVVLVTMILGGALGAGVVLALSIKAGGGGG